MVAAIIQARVGSTRLPGKIMKDLSGREVLWHAVERALLAKSADRVMVATTTNPEDDAVEKFCRKHNFLFYRGSDENVLERYYWAAKQFGADIIVRITADCPLIDPKTMDLCVEKFKKSGCDYISNVVPGPRTFPRGLDVEVFSFGALEKAHKNAGEIYEKEHVTPYIWENKNGEFKVGETVTASAEYARNYRLTIDYPEDFELIKKIYQSLYRNNEIIDIRDAIDFLDKNPAIAKINADCEQKPVK